MFLQIAVSWLLENFESKERIFASKQGWFLGACHSCHICRPGLPKSTVRPLKYCNSYFWSFSLYDSAPSCNTKNNDPSRSECKLFHFIIFNKTYPRTHFPPMEKVSSSRVSTSQVYHFFPHSKNKENFPSLVCLWLL